MVTLWDLFDLVNTTTSLDLCAYDPDTVQLLQQFIIGPDSWQRVVRAPGLHALWAKGMLTSADRKINVHNAPRKNGPEMKWAVAVDQIAPELYDAKVWSLHLRESPVTGTELVANIDLSPLQVEAVKAFFKEEVK